MQLMHENLNRRKQVFQKHWIYWRKICTWLMSSKNITLFPNSVNLNLQKTVYTPLSITLQTIKDVL